MHPSGWADIGLDEGVALDVAALLAGVGYYREEQAQAGESGYRPFTRGTCRIQNRRSPEIPRCSNFEHFTDARKDTER